MTLHLPCSATSQNRLEIRKIPKFLAENIALQHWYAHMQAWYLFHIHTDRPEGT